MIRGQIPFISDNRCWKNQPPLIPDCSETGNSFRLEHPEVPGEGILRIDPQRMDASCPSGPLTPPRTTSSLAWFSTPVHFYSAEVVFAGTAHTHPLLLIRSGTAYGGDGGHAIFTQLFHYDRRSNRFESIFDHATGSNNNQQTRFIARGPLRGDVVVAVPTAGPPYAYWIRVYTSNTLGHKMHLVLR